MRRFFYFFILLSLFISGQLQAGFKEDILSPFNNDDASKVLWIGGSTTLVLSLFKKQIVRKIQKDISEDAPLCCQLTRPGNTYLQVLPNALYAVGFGFHYLLHQDDQDDKRKALGMTKATLYSGLITDIIKPIVNEKRPNGSNHSFPSGHTTTAFAFASFVASEHPWYVGVPAYVMASYVGFCRMQDNFHFLHDVVAGATIGMSYGIAISQSSRGINSSPSAFIALPTDDLKGLAFNYSLQF